jgi:hypothetical protein
MRNNPDVVVCGRRTGPGLGLLCENCEGRCPSCDSHYRLVEPAHICGECAAGAILEKCIMCGGVGKYPAKYCEDCVLRGKNRDGCPRIVNAGISRNDMIYERRRAAGVSEI